MTGGAKFTLDGERHMRVGEACFVHGIATATQVYGNTDVIATVDSHCLPYNNGSPFAVFCHVTRDGSIVGRWNNMLQMNASGQIKQSWTANNGAVGDIIEFMFFYKGA